MSNDEEEKSEGNMIEVHIKIPKPESPKVVMVHKESPVKAVGDATASKVKKFGSVLEKDAVHAVGQFKRKGIHVKDSRSS
jgi:hypothetical protein